MGLNFTQNVQNFVRDITWYRCVHKHHMHSAAPNCANSVRMDWLDRYVWDKLYNFVQDPVVFEERIAQRIDRLQAQQEDTAQNLDALTARLEGLKEERRRVATMFRRNFGNRHVKVKTKDGTKEFELGTIVVATGSKTFDPARMHELRYDNPNVITTVELEQFLVEQREKGGGLKRSDGKVPKTVNFIQCVGSRDKVKGNLHCSLVCCTYAIGMAREIKKLNPNADVYVHYIDLRGPYRGFEEFYQAAKEEGINFVRGRISE